MCNKGQTYYIGRNTVSLFAISSKWFRLDGLSLFILHRRPFRWCARDGPRGSLYVDRSGDRNNKQTTAPFFIFFFLYYFYFLSFHFCLIYLFFPFFSLFSFFSFSTQSWSNVTSVQNMLHDGWPVISAVTPV